MKILYIILTISFLMNTELKAQNEFELEPSQSMIMTGKGQGQDATINPYFGEKCYAVIENIEGESFSIRIQVSGKIIKEINISEGEKKKIILLENQELYLDPNPKGKSRALVSYEKMDD